MNEAISQVELVRQEVIPIPEQAKMIVVRDQVSLQKANLFFLDIKALRKKIADVFDPIISKAHAAHAEALAQKKEAEAPLILAEKYLNSQVTDYKREVDRLRAEEEERLRQKAIKEEAERRKKAEEEALKMAAKLEKLGAQEEAGMLLADAIEEAARPMEVYIPPPTTSKVELQGMTVKEYWHAEVYDLRALCKAIGEGKCPAGYVKPYMAPLNDLATHLKREMNIPGVRAISESKSAATGKGPRSL
jgi:hypothetical protein